ncbi:MAG: aminopeptidase P N-terminal domain-containing protein [Bryobacteraceae bacterium]
MRAAFLALAVVIGASPVTIDEYKTRRAEVRKKIDGIVVLVGATERENGDLRSGFWQEPNFFYLTGWEEPGAILVMTPEEELFFLPRRSANRERYTGPKLAPQDADAQARSGFTKVLPVSAFESSVRKLAESHERVFAVAGSTASSRLKTLLPLRDVSDAAATIARLRAIKSKAELDLIQRATDVTIAAHRAAWERMRPGLFEYQIAATMVGTYLDHGCQRNAYPPIVGSGPAAIILHYARNTRRIDAGELVLMDAGAECAGYAADITRTVPAGGRFTARQRELYEIVLGAQKAAIAAAKPGMTLTGDTDRSLVKVARDYINSRGKDRDGNPLGKYLLHGVSHHVGLEVHDAWDPTQPLAEGMVITVEPGIYIAGENIGIRIEDMVLITANGARVLSSALPKEADQIESALARQR